MNKFELKQLVLSLTNKCNLKCKHCYQESNKDTYFQLSQDMAKKIIKEALDLGLEHLVLSGGEPFYNKELLFELIRYSKKKGLFVTITTNGTMISESDLIILKELNVDKLQFSLDGHKREIHEFIRGNGTFEKTINSIKLATQLGINSSVMMVLFKINRDNFDKFCKFIEQLGVKELGVERFVLTGNGKRYEDLLISNSQIKAFYDEARQITSKYNVKIHFNDPLYNINFLKDKVDRKNFFNFCLSGVGCSAGINSLYIDEQLRITPCPLMNLQIDIYDKDKNLEYIWNNNTILNKLRHSNKFECGSCTFFKLCRGCRAASLSNNNIYLKDPVCFIND